MEDPLIWQIVLQVILIGLNAVFACAEIAVISMNDSRLSQLAAQGDKRAMKLARLTSQPARFLATIQVAITLSGFLGSAFAADNFSGMLTDFLLSVGVPASAATLDAISVVLITLILSYFTLVFGELVPKRLAMKKAEALALGLSGAISAIAKLASPIVSVLTASTNGILRLFGVDPNAEDEEVSEEEIRMLVDVGSQKGLFNDQEKDIIQNVFAFDDLSVGEFATHRTELSILWMDESQEEWEETIHGSRHSLYPICEESADRVIGVLSAKDYFRLGDKSRENVMAQAVRPVNFVPASIRADQLFKQMKNDRNHFSVVLDEYGGVAGIVTMNDLLEQLVGNLEDGEIPEPLEIEPLDSSTWKILGSAPLREVSERLKVKLPIEEGYDTFGGFVFGGFGAIPEDGSEIEIDLCSLHIKTLSIRGHRLESALVSKESGPQTEPEAK